VSRPACRRRAPRGLTLVELMVGLGVSILTIAAAMTLLIQEQHSYTTSAQDRSEQEAGRMALREITRRLRTAGYGVDSNLVLDFGTTAQVPRTNLIDPATNVAFAPYNCATDVQCRDSTDSTRSDELVFLTRDPLFSRVVTAVTPTSVTVMGQLKQPMYAGQLLQVSCLGGTRSRAYVTVAADVAAPANPNAATAVTITLLAGQEVGVLHQFGRENATLLDPCFAIATAGQQPILTAVDRTRFYVDWYTDAGARVAPQTAGARPYLMLDRGLTPGAGGATVGSTPVPIAPDVEDLQLSYLYGPAVAGGPQRPVGTTLGVGLAADPVLPMTTAVVPPAYDDPPDAASRTTGHPANINAVRVSVVVRSSDADISKTSDYDRTVPAAGNRPEFLGQPYYRRALFETTVYLRNLQTVAFTYPSVYTGGGSTAGFNLGGG
jgi:type IV pilus assembly protein PilW